LDTTPSSTECKVDCAVLLPHPVYFGWGNGQLSIDVNQTAVTVVVEVSLKVTKTSTVTNTEVMQSYYKSAPYDRISIASDGEVYLSESGVVA
jgi:hypothetical protein